MHEGEDMVKNDWEPFSGWVNPVEFLWTCGGSRLWLYKEVFNTKVESEPEGKSSCTSEKVQQSVPQLQLTQWKLYCFSPHDEYLMEQP